MDVKKEQYFCFNKAWLSRYFIKNGETIQTKWRNIKDAFIRSIKKKRLDETETEKYLYYDIIDFLLKIKEINLNKFTLTKETNLQDETIIDNNQESKYDNIISFENMKNQHESDSVKKETIKPNKRRELNEDEAFFVSILPLVRRMTDEDRLEFRINVLSLIKDINRRACK